MKSVLENFMQTVKVFHLLFTSRSGSFNNHSIWNLCAYLCIWL